MKKRKKVFTIYLASDRIHQIEGEIMTVCENTGQSIIYGSRNPHYTEIVAVVPASMVVIVEEKIVNTSNK